MGADMELGQAVGIAKSLLKTNVPEYSKIPADISPQGLLAYFLKICYRHTKEYVSIPMLP